MPEKAAAAAIEFCFGPLAANPHRLGKPLKRDLTGYHTARRGEYRVVYRIDEVGKLVHVVRIEHRGDVYRPPLTMAVLSGRSREAVIGASR